MEKNKLDKQDLRFAVLKLPKRLKEIMMSEIWAGKIFVAGGYMRAIVSREPLNDIDLFVGSKETAKILSEQLAERPTDIYETDNAYTIKGKIPLQVIHRWVFDKPEDISNSFDFTICCAVIYCERVRNSIISSNEEHKFDYKWDSYCDELFYVDLANKRLRYRCPVRNEDAGGSMLRVLKYYQRGYRIPLDSLGNVMARMIKEIEFGRFAFNPPTQKDEKEIGKIMTGLLRVVDPLIDPTREAHLPSINDDDNNE
ncbi:MAG: hypothetical protein WC358_00015 [Ignavibacteria bacterium]|jgi:hypothetical protein